MIENWGGTLNLILFLINLLGYMLSYGPNTLTLYFHQIHFLLQDMI